MTTHASNISPAGTDFLVRLAKKWQLLVFPKVIVQRNFLVGTKAKYLKFLIRSQHWEKGAFHLLMAKDLTKEIAVKNHTQSQSRQETVVDSQFGICLEQEDVRRDTVAMGHQGT